jgi:transcriptional regulator with XRE-family HTH domain
MAAQAKKHKDIASEDQEVLLKIGNKIKELRQSKKKSYKIISDEIGISRNNYLLIEHGNIYCKLSTLMIILKYHNITLIDFFKSLEQSED